MQQAAVVAGKTAKADRERRRVLTPARKWREDAPLCLKAAALLRRRLYKKRQN
jgi:hypothetical protein